MNHAETLIEIAATEKALAELKAITIAALLAEVEPADEAVTVIEGVRIQPAAVRLTAGSGAIDYLESNMPAEVADKCWKRDWSSKTVQGVLKSDADAAKHRAQALEVLNKAEDIEWDRLENEGKDRTVVVKAPDELVAAKLAELTGERLTGEDQQSSMIYAE